MDLGARSATPLQKDLTSDEGANVFANAGADFDLESSARRYFKDEIALGGIGLPIVLAIQLHVTRACDDFHSGRKFIGKEVKSSRENDIESLLRPIIHQECVSKDFPAKIGVRSGQNRDVRILMRDSCGR
jgi:hypothetical protein